METKPNATVVRTSFYWALLIVGLVVALARQWQINTSLGRENARLQEQLKAFDDAKNENAELQNERDRIHRIQDSEAQQIQALRAEVQASRQRTNELENTRLIQKRALEDAEAISALLTGEFQNPTPKREALMRVLTKTQQEAERAQVEEVANAYIRAMRIGGWLGLTIRDLRPEEHSLYQRTGAFIMAVEPEGPAGKAKLQSGDLVFGMDGRAITGVSDLKRELSGKSAGQPVALEVMRVDTWGLQTVKLVDAVVADWP